MLGNIKAALDGAVLKFAVKSGLKRILGAYGELAFSVADALISIYRNKKKMGKKDISELLEKTLKQFGIFTASNDEIATWTEAGFDFFLAYHNYRIISKNNNLASAKAFLEAARALINWVELFIPLFQK